MRMYTLYKAKQSRIKIGFNVFTHLEITFSTYSLFRNDELRFYICLLGCDFHSLLPNYYPLFLLRIHNLRVLSQISKLFKPIL